jgi:predicted alpha/beta hydrolase family esterase
MKRTLDPVRDATAAYDFLIVPGLSNSGVDHWQSYWSLAFRNSSRVLQDDWDNPKLTDWLMRLDAAIAAGRRPAVLICHSLSCSLAAHWAARNNQGRVVAALIVAPADVESADHTPESTRNFAPIPRAPFPVPTLVVASTNDPYVAFNRAQSFAESWGADFCNAGELGHINSESKLGFWPQGLLMLGQLLARVDA